MTTELPISGQSASFQFNPRYRCIRNLCHVMTATRALIAVFIVFWVMFVVLKLPVSLTYGIIMAVVAACAVLGVRQERHRLLWPFIGYSAVSFALALMSSVVFICLAFAFGPDIFDYFEETDEVKGGLTSPPPTNPPHMTGSSFFFVCLFIEMMVILCAMFCYWQMIVVYRCKEYLEEKNMANMPLIIDDPMSISAAARHYAISNGYDQSPPVHSDPPTVTATDEQHKF